MDVKLSGPRAVELDDSSIALLVNCKVKLLNVGLLEVSLHKPGTGTRFVTTDRRKLFAKPFCNGLRFGETLVTEINWLIGGLLRALSRKIVQQSPAFVRVIAMLACGDLFLPSLFSFNFNRF
jgi:hypothetical protein